MRVGIFHGMHTLAAKQGLGAALAQHSVVPPGRTGRTDTLLGRSQDLMLPRPRLSPACGLCRNQTHKTQVTHALQFCRLIQ